MSNNFYYEKDDKGKITSITEISPCDAPCTCGEGECIYCPYNSNNFSQCQSSQATEGRELQAWKKKDPFSPTNMTYYDQQYNTYQISNLPKLTNIAPSWFTQQTQGLLVCTSSTITPNYPFYNEDCSIQNVSSSTDVNSNYNYYQIFDKTKPSSTFQDDIMIKYTPCDVNNQVCFKNDKPTKVYMCPKGTLDVHDRSCSTTYLSNQNAKSLQDMYVVRSEQKPGKFIISDELVTQLTQEKIDSQVNRRILGILVFSIMVVYSVIFLFWIIYKIF